MSKPIPGALYVIQKSDIVGDTNSAILERLAEIAFGDTQSARKIEVANQVQAIGVGTVLKMPEAVDSDLMPELKVNTKGLVLVIDGIEYKTESLRFLESDETMINAWSAVLQWQPREDLVLDAVLQPYTYPKSAVYLDGQLIATGRLYNVSPSLTGRRQVACEFFSLGVDALDSAMAPPYEESNVTLKQRAQTLLKPFGLSVSVDLEEDGVFDRVTAQDSQTVGAHLMDLARQRGALVSSNKKGGLIITVPKSSGTPVATIEEGKPGYSGFSASFNGRERFSDYRMLGESPSDEPLNFVVQDDQIPVTRFKTIQVKDTTQGGLAKAGAWEKVRYLSKSLAVPITAQGFFSSPGKRWAKGDFVTLISPTLFINDGRLMRVRAVEFLSASNALTTTLSLVPAQIYETGEYL